MFTLVLSALLPLLAIAHPIPKAAEQVEVRRPNFIRSSSSSSHHGCHPCAESSSSGEECCPDFVQEAVFLQHDVGFYHFDFPAGNSNALAFRTFYFSYPFTTLLGITDCFCTGDRFIVAGSSNTNPPFSQSTTVVPIDKTCSIYQTSPFTCLFDPQGRWSRIDTLISVPAGNWNITITPIVAPFLAGTGYVFLLKADGPNPECTNPNSPLYPCVWSVFN